jgi:hypothetical protein
MVIDSDLISILLAIATVVSGFMYLGWFKTLKVMLSVAFISTPLIGIPWLLIQTAVITL